MKTLFFLSILIIGSFSQAQSSKGLQLAGTVPLKAEVKIQYTKTGVAHIQSKSSPELRTEVDKRKPASIVRVSAP
ncbi:hypothetical protein AZI87_07895 [Bdellovibrio bacteriovorus]|uniref:Uncharacterized protein n=1 Tax=Bdellovibrio bacteriovorus TaxID=959 RepID=A0A162GX53_BDEBC|nr:hypothetical protein [Bdellovibrio bacteriovorus]KYG69132.1 hypothetical protein AZI87_07895 [Bdellovibrio bacteriovorus]